VPPPWNRRLRWELSRTAFMADVLGVTPYDWQEAMLDGPQRFALVNAARQSGKSQCANTVVAHQMGFHDESLAVVVTHGLTFSAEFVRRVRHLLRDADLFPGTWPVDNVHSIELPNGGRLLALPATERVRGFSRPDIIILDEAAQIPDPVYDAITPTQAANYATARLWGISTPFGRRGWWHREWTEGGADWWRLTKPAAEVPHIHADILRKARRRSELKYRSEYCCEFVGTEHQAFPPELLDRMFGRAGDVETEQTVATLTAVCAETEGAESEVSASRWAQAIDWAAP